jgi:hypothetical protein
VSEDDAPQKDTRSLIEMMEPERAKGSRRELPLFLRSSFALVWQAGRRQFLRTAGIQVAPALSLAAQLLVARAVRSSALRAHDVSHALPPLGR